MGREAMKRGAQDFLHKAAFNSSSLPRALGTSWDAGPPEKRGAFMDSSAPK